MSTNLTTNGIILRRTNYGEADRILTVLTPSNGQISVIARGVRREKSRLAGGIELFAECGLGLVRGTMNTDGMWTLTSSRIITFYNQIMSDYERLQFGYESIKQIAKLSNDIESPDLYDTLKQTFAALNNASFDVRLIKIWFYLHLATLQGNELNLLTDSHGMKLVEGARYDFDIAERVLIYNEDGRFDTDIIKLLRLLMVNPVVVIGRLRGLSAQNIVDALYLARVGADV